MLPSSQLAWEKYHKELEQLCWAEHLGGPSPNDDKAIVSVWMMKLIFHFTWDKATIEVIPNTDTEASY